MNYKPMRHVVFSYHTSQVLSDSAQGAWSVSISKEKGCVLESFRPSRRFVSASYLVIVKRLLPEADQGYYESMWNLPLKNGSNKLCKTTQEEWRGTARYAEQRLPKERGVSPAYTDSMQGRVFFSFPLLFFFLSPLSIIPVSGAELS